MLSALQCEEPLQVQGRPDFVTVCQHQARSSNCPGNTLRWRPSAAVEHSAWTSDAIEHRGHILCVDLLDAWFKTC